MITFDRLKISGFMPFSGGPYEIPLRDCGLVFIIGENRISKMADSNGAGKTAIFDALSWAFYDRVLRGTQGDRIVNRQSKFALVEAIFSDGSANYTVRNSRSGGIGRKWTLHANQKAVHDPRDLIERILGLSFTAFSNTMLFGQGISQRFAVLPDSRRKQLLDELLDTVFFLEKRSIVDQELKELLNTQDEIESESEKAKAVVTALEEQRRQTLEIVQDVREREFENWFAQHEGILSNLETLEREFGAYLNFKRELSAQKDLVKEETNLKEIYFKIQARRLWFKREFDRLETQMSQVLETDVCPLCFRGGIQEVREYIERHYQRELRNLRHREGFLRLLEDPHHYALAHECEDAERITERYGSQVRAKLATIQDLSELISTQSESLEKLLREIDTKLAQISGGAEAVEKELDEIADEIRLREFWLEGFGHQGLKVMILRDYEGFLRERLDRYGSLLTAGELKISFSAHRRLKSGESREQIGFDVINQYGAHCYEDLSSGEKQRVDLCMIFALQDLVRELHRARMNVALYDEIFEHFDEAGCESIMEFLTQQRRDFGSIFVISQNPKLLAYPCDRLVRVIKRREGSEIIVE